MKVIIVGSGKVGEKLLEKLSAEPEIEITAVDIKPDAVSDIVSDYDAMVRLADAFAKRALEILI